MDLSNLLTGLICGVLGGIAGTALFIKLKKKDQ